MSPQSPKSGVAWATCNDNKQHPKDLGVAEVEKFLHHLAVVENCSVSTQKIALNALAFSCCFNRIFWKLLYSFQYMFFYI